MNNAISSFIILDKVTAFAQIIYVWSKKPFNRKQDTTGMALALEMIGEQLTMTDSRLKG
jgi:hypothetical protein